LSDYYYATDPVGSRIDPFPVRLWFCGILFAVGVFLYKYEGFSKNENRWLSAAGSFVLGVAMFPTAYKEHGDWDWVFAWSGISRKLSLHGIFAFLAFACIAVVIVRYADSSLSELKATRPAVYKRFKTAYRLIAAFMGLSIIIAIILHIAHYPSYILVAEWCGIWAFAGYWFVKNWELTEVAKVLKARKAPLRPRTEADLADKL
jgi:hypothetical protein